MQRLNKCVNIQCFPERNSMLCTWVFSSPFKINNLFIDTNPAMFLFRSVFQLLGGHFGIRALPDMASHFRNSKENTLYSSALVLPLASLSFSLLFLKREIVCTISVAKLCINKHQSEVEFDHLARVVGVHV